MNGDFSPFHTAVHSDSASVSSAYAAAFSSPSLVERSADGLLLFSSISSDGDELSLVSDLNKDLRRSSLTSCLSKVAEDCILADYVKPAVLNVLDPNQYGAVPKSSTT